MEIALLLLVALLGISLGLLLTIKAMIWITCIVVGIVIILIFKFNQDMEFLVAQVGIIFGLVLLVPMWITAAISLGWMSSWFQNVQIFR